MKRDIPEWIRSTPVAHRGLHGPGAPENSIAAVDAAADAGFPAEIDVRLLADGVPAVFHDASVERVTNGTGSVAELDSVAFAALRFTGLEVSPPLLVELLAHHAGRTPLLVEIKNEGDVSGIEEATWDVLREYDGPFAIQSFRPQSIAWFREHAPDVFRGLLGSDFRTEVADRQTLERLRRLDSVGQVDPDFVGFDVRCLPSRRIEELRSQGMTVLGWTVRSHTDEGRARRYCDNVIFEGYAPRR